MPPGSGGILVVVTTIYPDQGGISVVSVTHFYPIIGESGLNTEPVTRFRLENVPPVAGVLSLKFRPRRLRVC